ncbi:penicillin-binding protein [Elizabethkingia anophelis]|uniref:penicillin-binding protein n=1 Tax=Elizabethkingia anophelis TaxID=1117645 RepID=UPI0012B1FCDA|nr:penicillin-binding protein [Elizabethkingia anophelis]QGN24322.1 penicillin-binding protein [Elizabethkingia anophelis]QNV10963.1 penicillin-binding protein [Elizabethkingia anophelis]UTF89117.1 penicillin-binding protein [Elizabethkingia anophelis]UTG00039.1 penicillin-binding protein [Elizabethkingia anophelis]UTG03754.1 penicillin-binding protein [Elizabethkingia anophelis]
MTRSNLHIKLSNGKSIICVADSSSAPEQGYIVEHLLLPLLSIDDSEQEMALLSEHCTMDERRCNATYRYTIDLTTKEVKFFEEHYSYAKDNFRKGKDITERYNEYVETIR